MANSTSASSGAKSRKPAFPLWLHRASGLWVKKIRGRCYYFGKDRDLAIKEYLRVQSDLEAGRQPPPADNQMLTLRDLCNAFLTHKRHQSQVGEIEPRTFHDYYTCCERLLLHLGKSTAVANLRPEDLLRYRRKLSDTCSASTVGVEVSRVRVLLKYAFESGLVDRPIRVGEFKRPAKAVMRRERAAKGARMFEAHELQTILGAVEGQLKAMVLLGCNAGFGNMDCARLPIAALNLESGWVDFPRPKTGIPRRCPLWPETVEALREVLADWMPPKDEKYAGLVFLTHRGGAWYQKDKPSSALGHEFGKVLDRLGLHREGVGFYGLRHTFQTIADQIGDYLATRKVMGHSDGSISDAYRERFPDSRLVAVSDHVRAWLFGDQEEADEPATLPIRKGGVA